MRRLILRLMLLCLLLTLGAVLGSVALGYSAPPPAIAVAIDVPSRVDPSRMIIAGVDTPTGVTYARELGDVRWWAWSDDGCHIALITAGDMPETRVLDVREGKWLRYQATGYGYLSWSATGTRAALPTQAGDGLLLLDTLNGASSMVALPDGETLQAFIWSPDGASGILITRRITGVYLNYKVDTATGTRSAPADAIAPLINLPQQHAWRWSPDSRYVVAPALPDVLVWDVQQNTLKHVLPRMGFARVAGLAWLNADELMLLGTPQVTAGIGTTSAEASAAGSTAIETANDILALIGYRWQISSDTLNATPLQTVVARTPPIFAPDGTRLLDDDGATVRVLDARTGDVLLSIAHPNLRPMPKMWSPDGRYLLLASTRQRNVVRLVDTQTGSITEQTVAWDVVLAWAQDSGQFSGFQPKDKRVTLLRPDANGAITLSHWTLGSSAQVCYP